MGQLDSFNPATGERIGSVEAIEPAAVQGVVDEVAEVQPFWGELLVCPICVKSRKIDEDGFVPNARLAGATPMWEWLGDGGTVFSY